MSKRELMAEFREFAHFQSAPPAAAFPKLASRVQQDLHPPFHRVMLKFALVHLAAAVPVLAVCPQLGVGPFWLDGHGILHPFMALGSTACAAICGVIFLGFTGILAVLFLRPEQLRQARRFEWANLSVVTAFTLMTLMVLGNGGSAATYLGWVVGAALGGWITLQAGTQWRLA